MSDEQVVELETQARNMGWRPKEEFRGEEDKWVDAKTYVDRGEHVLPIIKATNDRLRQDLIRTNESLASVNAALLASKETITALERYHQDDVKQKVEAAREKLKTELVAAKKSGDVESEVDLTSELSKLDAAEAIATTTEADTKKQEQQQRPAPKDYTKEPEFIAWQEANPWFGTDMAKTAIADAAQRKLRAEGEKTLGREFLDKVSLEVTKEITRLGGNRSTNKVEGSKGGEGGASGGGGTKSKSYSDLPAEAKEACRGFNRELVGPNRLHKTEKEWQDAYAAQYFSEV